MIRPALRSALAAAALALLLAAPAARAGSATANLTVNATVVGICTIDASTMNFPNYDGAQQDAFADVTVHCTQGSSYWIGLNAGQNSPNGTTRRMVNGGANFLTYELYHDGGRTQVWDNAETLPHSSAGNAGLSAYTVQVYGRIAAGQTPPMGAYVDTVQMTVNF